MLMPLIPKTAVLILFTFFSCRLFASPQVPDYIIYKNDTLATTNLILEQYLQSIETKQRESLFGLAFRENATLTCWRGYQAIYKIENDSLFLTDIISCEERRLNKIDKLRSGEKIKSIFGDKVKNGKVYIFWFTGVIKFPLNNKLLRWDGVFYTIYEKETVITVEGGKMLSARDVVNYIDDPGSINRRYGTKISRILFKKLKRVRWKNIDSLDCSDTYLVTIGKDGKVSGVRSRYYADAAIDANEDDEEYNYCINKIYEALKNLRFDIIMDKGEPISEEIYLEIRFEKGKIEKWTD